MALYCNYIFLNRNQNNMQLCKICSQFKRCLILVYLIGFDFKLIILYANYPICCSTIQNSSSAMLFKLISSGHNQKSSKKISTFHNTNWYQDWIHSSKSNGLKNWICIVHWDEHQIRSCYKIYNLKINFANDKLNK